MNANQRQRAKSLLNEYRPGDDAPHVYHMAALLQELVDADEKFKSNVVAAINGASPDARHVEVDGQPVFFRREGDDITDTHTLSPCPHCGGSGAAADCAPAPSVPDGWRGLTDVEWMNIVNFDCAYSSYDKEGAVNEAVKRTEAKLKELNAAQQQEPPSDLAPEWWRSAIAKEFPLYDDDGLDEDKHCCEWVMLQERKRLHKILAAPTPAEAPADLVRDAARYRWLRNPTTDPALVIDKRVGPSFWDYEYRAGDELDAAIDAAIERDKLKGQS